MVEFPATLAEADDRKLQDLSGAGQCEGLPRPELKCFNYFQLCLKHLPFPSCP